MSDSHYHSSGTIREDSQLAKRILVNRYYHAESRSKAIDIVREFVIEKQLIITGGLVVDFALRLKGSHIYEDYEVPDYDFFSSSNVRDACELFDKLMLAGFDNISLMAGIHPSTIKIFVFKDCVADITYSSKKWFTEMKKSALTYNGMLFRNPYIQYVDMHRAFSFPYENEPRETINFRWEKDFQRFAMLYHYYPILDHATDTHDSYEYTRNNHKLFSKYVICGRFAIEYYLNSRTDLVGDHVYLMDESDYSSFISSNSNRMRNIKKYKPYHELLPERTEFDIGGEAIIILHCRNKTGIYYLDNQDLIKRSVIESAKSRLASRHAHTFSAIREDNSVIDRQDGHEYTHDSIRICSINFCIIYCFSMYHVTGDKSYDVYYSRLLQLVYNSYIEANIKYYPSIITYGKELEKPIIMHITEHPEYKISPVHIASDDDPDVREAQLAKLPRDFIPPKDVYDLDGSLTN